MIFSSVSNLADKDYSMETLKSISTSIKEKLLWIFWDVKSKVSSILGEYKEESITNNERYSVNNEIRNKVSSNDNSYNVLSNKNDTLNKKITWVYKYTNSKWKVFGFSVVDNVIQNILSSDWKKVSPQQKWAIQRLLNKNQLSKFQLLERKKVQEKKVVSEDKTVVQIKTIQEKTPVIEIEPIQKKSSVVEIKPALQKESNVKPKISTQNTAESNLTEQEVNQRVKIVVDRIVDADKRNKSLVDVYTKLKKVERWLFANNFSQQLSVAKKVIEDLSQIIPKTNQKGTNIQVNTNLLNRVIKGMSIYLEKTWLENAEAEKNRDLLVNMLQQSKYILQGKLEPKSANVWKIYERVYA